MTDADRWARVSALFDEALRRPPGERRAFVETAARGDALVAGEVLSLLSAHDRAGGFLETPAARLSADLLGEAPAPWQEGTTAGAYRILRQVGRGGMGIVYLAEDTRLGRPVALKVLDPRHVSDPRRRERLRKEAQSAARLRHPNIATVYALEEIDGRQCMAAEYVNGRTLREVIDEGVPDPDTVLRIAAGIAGALDAAHRQHIVHRDLKPENVMLDEDGVVRLLDFGVALALGDEPGKGSRLTDPGIVVGTPGYMAPEQIEGQPVDFRTDQFLFGVLVYELATGIHPFRAATRASTDARILSAEPVRIAQLSSGPLAGLDQVLRICLKKSPSERFPSTASLVQALARLAAQRRGTGEAPAAEPAGIAPIPPTPAMAWWRVHLAVVSVAISGMLVGSWWLARWIGAPYRYPLFFGLLVAGVAEVTLRMNLLFVERQAPTVMPRQLKRTSVWVRRLDLLFGVVYGLAALAVSEAHPAAAGFALAAAAILSIAAVVIEPATTDEAHGRSSSSSA